jgi:hypothetical protein
MVIEQPIHHRGSWCCLGESPSQVWPVVSTPLPAAGGLAVALARAVTSSSHAQ